MELTNRMFDLETLATRLEVDSETLEQLIREAQEEFADDDMLAELHVVRALRQYKRENAG